jgi:hypothetical protein
MGQTIKIYQQFLNKTLRNFGGPQTHVDDRKVRGMMQHLDPADIGFTDLAEQPD